MNGQNVIISAAETLEPLAACKTLNLDHNCDTIEIGAQDAGEYRQFIPGRKDWSVQTGIIVKSTTNVVMAVGKTYMLTIEEKHSNNTMTRLQGRAICSKAQITANVGNVVSGSFSFKGSGPLVPLERIDQPFTLNESEIGGSDYLV